MKPKQPPEPTVEQLLEEHGLLDADLDGDDGISIPTMNHGYDRQPDG